MSRQAATGIQNILSGILSSESPRASTPAPESPVGDPHGRETDGNNIADERRTPTTGARRGRPLGKPPSAAQPKTKVTLWLPSNIVALYRDWSWEVRSQFSHLVEKALTDYHKRQHVPKSAPR